MNQAASAASGRPPAGSTATAGCCPMFSNPFFMNTFATQAPLIAPPPPPPSQQSQQCFLGPQAAQILTSIQQHQQQQQQQHQVQQQLPHQIQQPPTHQLQQPQQPHQIQQQPTHRVQIQPPHQVQQQPTHHVQQAPTHHVQQPPPHLVQQQQQQSQQPLPPTHRVQLQPPSQVQQPHVPLNQPLASTQFTLPTPVSSVPFYSIPQMEQALALLTNPQVANNIFSQILWNIYFQSGLRSEQHTHHNSTNHFHHHLHGTHHHHHTNNAQENGPDATMPADSLANSESKPKGLNRAEIDSLTHYVHTDEKDSRTCVICLSRFELKSKIRHLSCNHAFHAKCVDKWLRANRTCPICRRDALKTHEGKIKRV